MINTTLFSIFGDTSLANNLRLKANIATGDITLRAFPDEETYIKINTPIESHNVILLASLNNPNLKILPLLLTAATARDLGAKKIGLIAPYTAYMRQDKRFNPGEGVTSAYFAKLLSHYFDWFITVDPHLHRRGSLNEIFTIPTAVVEPIKEISNWIYKNVTKPVLIGPDHESQKLVIPIAQQLSVPYLIAQKQRLGDRQVVVTMPALDDYRDHTPVIVDDIISTGKTVIANLQKLKEAQMPAPFCIAIHAVFTNNSYEDLLQYNLAKIVTCNTIEHASNGIDLSESILEKIRNFN